MPDPDFRGVLFAHAALTQEYGGLEGVRDLGALQGAIDRPWGSSYGREHFPTPFDKAAALCEALIRRHPFVDGNKRTGVAMGAYLLFTFGYELEATQKELEEFGVEVGRGALNMEEISRWFEDHARELSS